MSKRISRGKFAALRERVCGAAEQIERAQQRLAEERQAEESRKQAKREAAERARRAVEEARRVELKQRLDAMSAGSAARLRGHRKDRCPYSPGHPLRESWMLGWHAEHGTRSVQRAQVSR